MAAAPPQSSGSAVKTPVIAENAVALNHEILEALKGLLSKTSNIIRYYVYYSQLFKYRTDG